MPTRSRRAFFREVLTTLLHSRRWRGVFGELDDTSPIALRPPIPLPDLDGTGERLNVTPETVEAVRGWFATRGMETEACDVEHAIIAAAVAGGSVEYRFLPRALRAWWNAS